MPTSYFAMWGMLILMALGAVGELAIQDDFFGSVQAAYPADLIEREALTRCGQMGAKFSRFSQNDRETCYHAILPAHARASTAVVLTASAPNDVDLRQAAGLAGVPRNDIRVLQQSNGPRR
jgi:hypothetical protein